MAGKKNYYCRNHCAYCSGGSIRTLLEQAGKKVVDFAGIISNPTYQKGGH